MTTQPSRRFRLETVLSVAASREEHLAMEMAGLQQTHRTEEARLALLRDQQTTAQEDARATKNGDRVSVSWLAQATAHAEALMDRIHEQMGRLEASVARLEGCRTDLVAASQRKRMLEKLKGQQRERWESHVERLEVLEATEVATNQYLQRQAEETSAGERDTSSARGRGRSRPSGAVRRGSNE